MSTIEGVLLAAKIALQGFTANEQRQAQKDAKNARRRESNLRRQQAAEENRKKRIEQLRKGRRARATAQAQAISAGVSGGSGLAGTEASIGSQTASNLNFLDSSNQRGQLIADAQNSYLNATSRGQMWSIVTGAGSSIAGAFDDE